ncbi:MAG TPA: hypothetical protein VI298_15550 [Geobacteraceae bacterium]
MKKYNQSPTLLFAAPLTWVALVGTAKLLEKTAWGSSGHPSNALVISICLILGAPLFGILGIIYALTAKMHKSHAKTISILLNLLIVAVGIGFCVWWFK